MKLPPVEEQRADVARKQAWRLSFIPKTNFRAGRLNVTCQLLYDELVTDLGLNKFRKAGFSCFLKGASVKVWQKKGLPAETSVLIYLLVCKIVLSPQCWTSHVAWPSGH